ncbi:TetR/AcrR family transcriptional regulator [Nocardia caishijiensis]|uniref:TetR family transcriptional regulator n=1 Tax=Nocardia caishijiensis TaxID=184756 RepID=A0ABQ6YEJ6_9NOCA|nr:TetR family transcriptional regulator [Nocardia caishijiensis]KAF0835836.1 TetR family transcriptional regulator [Nocardia caishijiensis]
MTTQQGLRARKKQQTREQISHRATELFLERGFDKVTIAEIAAAADVAKMTVTNYFPRKEDLALDLGAAYVQQLAAIVRDRAPGQSALAALRGAYLAAVVDQDPVIGFSGAPFAKMITDSPALTARLREFHDEREAALARALAEETGAASDEITPRVAAAQLAGVHRVLFEEILRRTLAGESGDEIATALADYAEVAFDALEPGLAGYAVR